MKYDNIDELEKAINKSGKTVLNRNDKRSIFFDTTTLTQIIMVLLARLNAAGKETEDSANKTTELISKINSNVCKTLDISHEDMKKVLMKNSKMVIHPKDKDKLNELKELIENMPDGKGAEA